MNDTELLGAWAALEPDAAQRRRIDTRVRNWLDAHETSLAAEWLALLKFRPFAGFSFAAVAGSLVLVATPLSWVTFAVL